MMDNASGYSLSDIRTAVDGNAGMGGDFLLLVLFLFLFGQNGFGQHGFGGAATAAAQNEILSGQQFDRVGQKLDAIGQGICDSTYALNNSIKDCCCENRLGIANLGAHIDQAVGSITAMFKDAENQRLRDRVGSLELRDAMCGVVRYPTQMSYATNCNPFCGNGCGYSGYQPNI